jgi:hypothetical protein
MERARKLFGFLVSDFFERVYFCNSPEVWHFYVTVGTIASFHLDLQSKKPWNQVLGETYIAQWSNGPIIYTEQISHHPPVTFIQIYSQINHWTIDATLNFEIDLGVAKTTIHQKRLTRLWFADGCTYELEFPSITVLGTIQRRSNCVRARTIWHEVCNEWFGSTYQNRSETIETTRNRIIVRINNMRWNSSTWCKN